MEMYVQPEQGITARNWKIIEIQDFYCIWSGGIRDSRRSTPITDVNYKEDHAVVTTNSGSTYLLYPEQELESSTHSYENLYMCIKEVPELTQEELEAVEEHKKKQDEALEKFVNMGGFF